MALSVALSAIVIGTIFLANLDPVFPASTDLMVEGISWEPEHPISGSFLYLHGSIKNVGDNPSSDKYAISLYVDDWWIDGWLVRLAGFQPTVSPKITPGRTQAWHFRISDYAVFKQGGHQVKAVVNEPNDPNPDNNELVKTLSISPSDYSDDFNIVNYGMCKRIDEYGLPVNITNIYDLNDELAISYVYTDIKHADSREKMGQKTNLTFRSYSPNGTLHQESNSGYSILLVRDRSGREITGFASQLSLKKGDPGYQGEWRVEVLNKGHLLFAKRFIIEDVSTRTLSTTTSTPRSTLMTEQTQTTGAQEPRSQEAT